MSQSTFPFGDEPQPFVEEESAERSKRTLLLAAGGAVVLLAGGFFFLGGGGEAEEDTFVSSVGKRPAAAAKVAEKPKATLPTAYKEQLGRSPFLAQYVVPAAAPAGAAAPGTPAPLAPAPGGVDGLKPAPQAPAPAPAPVTKRYQLKLVSINEPNGEVRTTTWLIDGKRQTVLPAQRFGKYGELVVLAFSQNSEGVVDTAILQVGDDTPIEVKVGETNNVM